MPEGEKIEKQELSKEIITEWYQEKGISLEKMEKKELSDQDLDPPQFLSSSVAQQKEDKKSREEEKKLSIKRDIKHLIAIAEEKGLEYSIKEAQKKNNPFLLDIYHDVLAKDSSYKRFLSK